MTPFLDTDPAPPKPPLPEGLPVFIPTLPCDHVGLSQLNLGTGEGLPTSGPPDGEIGRAHV